MMITDTKFILSAPNLTKCPQISIPEFAFIGRSNVGKSSLINMLCGRKELAKTSSKPGKTQTINFFLINNQWHLIDLPGYGYAKIAKARREKWEIETRNYLLKREQLQHIFLLIDVRIPPQAIDLEFMDWLVNKELSFSIIFTKCDKLSSTKIRFMVKQYQQELLFKCLELPLALLTSSQTKRGKEEILHIIENLLHNSFQETN